MNDSGDTIGFHNSTHPAEWSKSTVSTLLRHPSCYIIDTDYLVERFWLVTVLGSTLSTISIVENIFLFAVFVSSRQHRNSCSLYLMLLALSDTFISGTYILIMSVKVLYQFTESVYLKRMWVVYLVPMMTMSHITITTSSFLIVFATVERFCVTVSHHCVEFLQNNRKLIAFFAVVIGVFTKGTLLLEIVPVYDPDCADTLNEYHLEVTPLVIHNRHYKLWRFWFRNIVTILFPFFTLMYLNARIVNELRKNVYLGTQSSSTHNHANKAVSAKQRKVHHTPQMKFYFPKCF
ncbi:unnamed protein product [Anisakis simplex]|uniref:G_PROTEIN_RECEP_F1_2 domain-containing protein n=1 Tax=Anisakis simplex TaxID=6269 RepID=A0A0M3IZB2_ANISI|nr:unnamed protein product [Anisakis simplex]